MKQLNKEQIETVYYNALAKKEIGESDTSCIFYSKEILEDRLSLLKKNFPKETLHTIAIKTNSSLEVLKHIATEGFGLEAASMEEVLLAVDAGVTNQKIVFDSPVKTKLEIDYCHKNLPGIIVNANSIQELERYPENFSGRLGLRINPLVDADAPDILNVSKSTSKFGVPISQRKAIIKAALKHQKITGLHIHIGSGIKNYEANIIAFEKIQTLANEINKQRQEANISSQIEFIDIGGGIQFDERDQNFSISNFVNQLSSLGIFDQFQIVTEYGKFVHKDAAFVVSDIEYITDGEIHEDSKTAFIHVGADLFVRKVYSNLDLNFPFHIIRKESTTNLKEYNYNIAGPLCFAGDFLYYGISIPEITEKDKFTILEIGANTLSMWSQHCGRKKPKLILF